MGDLDMDYSYAIERHDFSKIDKLNNLENLDSFWDDVRKLTRNVNSDHSIGRWKCLADVRFNELRHEALSNYNFIKTLLIGEIGRDSLEMVMGWVEGKHGLPTNVLCGSNIDKVYKLKDLYNSLKKFNFI